MPDITAVKQLCKSHVAGELEFEQYRQERAAILDSLPLQPKNQTDHMTSGRKGVITFTLIGLITLLLLSGAVYFYMNSLN